MKNSLWVLSVAHRVTWPLLRQLMLYIAQMTLFKEQIILYSEILVDLIISQVI